MTDPREAQLRFREALRQLCLLHYEATEKAGVTTAQAAGIVAEECMHMSAFFVTRGSAWDKDGFLEECRKVYEWHKDVAAKEKAKPN